MATIVSVHAHPDDEALLTGGSLARWHAEGHRVVVVTATNGDQGLSSTAYGSGAGLAAVRRAELERSCAALGVDRVVCLDYPDSGSNAATSSAGLASQPVDEVAARVLAVVEDERADVVTSYDRNGGYGHPDHRQISRVGRYIAERLPTVQVIEATVDRVALQRALRLVARVPRLPAGFDPADFDGAFASRDEITHVVDVRALIAQKRSAFAAHASQSEADGGRRTLAWCRRLPSPVFARVFGREWYVEVQSGVLTPRADIRTPARW